MTSEWIILINALGKAETSDEFLELGVSIGETAQISEDPAEYNDPVGHTKYYKYIHSGLEVGFRKNILNHVHFYFDGYEGFAMFKGKLLHGLSSGWDEKSVIQVLGEPSSSGGGNTDMLLGYINRWIKYEEEGYALHLQIAKNGQLCRASLMYQE